MSTLFSPFQLGPLTLDNRIVVAPMCQYSAEAGQATAWHVMHLGQLAISGAGLLIIEATAVEAAGRITYGDLGLWNDETERALANTLKGIRKFSNIPIAIQLAHAGRKASCDLPWLGGKQIVSGENSWQTFAPSALAFNEGDLKPQALDTEGLLRVKHAFVDSAQRAQRLGLDAIELHAAHGYLLHEFLSPLANQRTDIYGGSLENCMRFVLEVFEAIRVAMPVNLPVGVRISGTDWVDGGWDIEQSVILAKALKKLGAAYIHVSSGGLSPAQTVPLHPNYQVALADKIHQEAEITTIAVGLITEAEQAEAIVAEGRADLVALARAMLYDPRWPWHAAAKLGATVAAPPQYLRCQPRNLKHLFDQ